MKRTARWIFAALLMFALFHYKIEISPAQLLSLVDDQILLAVQPEDNCCTRPCEQEKEPLNDQVLTFLQWKWS